MSSLNNPIIGNLDHSSVSPHQVQETRSGDFARLDGDFLNLCVLTTAPTGYVGLATHSVRDMAQQCWSFLRPRQEPQTSRFRPPLSSWRVEARGQRTLRWCSPELLDKVALELRVNASSFIGSKHSPRFLVYAGSKVVPDCYIVSGWLSRSWSLFGSLAKYGTYYLGGPKGDHNFDSHPNSTYSACKDSRFGDPTKGPWL